MRRSNAGCGTGRASERRAFASLFVAPLIAASPLTLRSIPPFAAGFIPFAAGFVPYPVRIVPCLVVRTMPCAVRRAMLFIASRVPLLAVCCAAFVVPGRLRFAASNVRLSVIPRFPFLAPGILP
jgi:hypothetical protein